MATKDGCAMTESKIAKKIKVPSGYANKVEVKNKEFKMTPSKAK